MKASPRDPGLAAKVAFLRRPDAYPERPRAVEAIETHFSWVFLTDTHAWKLKKPVRYDSLDFRTPALRCHDCEEEVRLNRRLAPDVYLGVVPLTVDAEGRLALGGEGEVVDWLVHMRRLPHERMLDHLLATRPLARAEVEPVARLLARFFARAEPALRDPKAYRARLCAGLREDRHALALPSLGLPAVRVRALADACLAFLERQAALFDRRVHEGRIVEGHGDLRPEHVGLLDPPVVIDALSFSRDLRIADPADELAFLALECERLGQPVVGSWFLEIYSEETGDAPPAPLVRFHRTYRALRRAKLAIWHVFDPGVDDVQKWRDRAERYLELAEPPEA
jgi:aminoglycoside phosphotransferase family enzyme